MFEEKILKPIIDSINRFGNLNAFCINEEFYSYNDLAVQISKIRLAIQKESIVSKNVGVVANDDIFTYASIFALWLEGLAYVPLHPQQPIERNLEIISQAEICMVITSSNPSLYSTYTIIESSKLVFENYLLEPKITSNNELAYILFTSGSTGKPKGVMITRNNIGAFMDSFWKTDIQINETDKCLQCFDLTFDVSVQGYLVPLTKGACCYTVPHGQIKYIYTSALIEDHKLTFAAMAPSMLRYMKPYFDEMDASSLKTCILTAEACPLKLMEEWYECAVNTEIYDFYGPTEATIYCTYYKLTKGGFNKSLNGIISIGKQMDNVTAIIVDDNFTIVSQGNKGELCVAGEQVTKGYWNNPLRNKESFFEKDYNGKLLRFYRTGDLCYIESDSNIMYSGRIDNQAKIQGFRVELGEIEFYVREFLKDKNAVAIAFENLQELTEIALFIESDNIDTTDLFLYLRSKLPSYMIPSKVFFEKIFPLNTNDKIDRNKLKTLIK